MYFRPYPILTFFSLIVLALLLWLGQWQWARAGWKVQLLEEYTATERLAPISLEEILCSGEMPDIGRAVLSAQAITQDWLRVYGRSPDGKPGWQLFSAVAAPECASASAILWEVGFETYSGDVRLFQSSRLSRLNSNKTSFSNENSPEENEWYWFDFEEMENALFDAKTNTLNRDYMLTANNGLPAHLEKTPPSRHIGYSITWYGMAIALIVLYAAFHMQAGRLRLNRNSED